MPAPAARTSKLDLRLSPHAKQALAEAARLSHRSVSQFVLESALARADEALAGRQHFALDAAHWADFIAALDAPPRRLPRIGRLLAEPGPFDPAE